MRRSGRLLVVEGLDGSGKTTFSKALAERLGVRWTTTPDPALRIVRDEVERAWQESARARRLFYAASVVACSDLCRPALAAGETVVVDRYWPSTAAYAALEGASAALDAVGPLVRPADVTFYLEVSEDVRCARLARRGVSSLDRASVTRQQDLRASYQSALRSPCVGRLQVLDADEAVDVLVTIALALLSELELAASP